jgi:hypothetical protein
MGLLPLPAALGREGLGQTPTPGEDEAEEVLVHLLPVHPGSAREGEGRFRRLRMALQPVRARGPCLMPSQARGVCEKIRGKVAGGDLDVLKSGFDIGAVFSGDDLECVVDSPDSILCVSGNPSGGESEKHEGFHKADCKGMSSVCKYTNSYIKKILDYFVHIYCLTIRYYRLYHN